MVVRKVSFGLKPRGIGNVGNTCFFNASMQVLLSIDELVYYYLNTEFSESMPLSRSFKEFIKSYEGNNKFSPYSLINILKEKMNLFDNKEQDSHEFVIEFIAALYDEFPNCKVKFNDKLEFQEYASTNIICNLFYSFNKQIVTCRKCRNESESYVLMSILPTRLKGSVQNGIDHFYEDERIDDIKTWKCEKCGFKGSFNKKLELIVPPKVLCSHLLRFNISKAKENSDVKINPKIKLKKFTFYLFGVVCHIGTLNNGHYFCEAKRLGEWMHYNDSSVSESKGIPDNSTPYLVFYSRL